MNHQQNNLSGLNLLLKDVKGFSQAQGAWRFYNNPNVDVESLNQPIIDTGVQEINQRCKEYVLIAYDWSHLDYRGHHAKEDCIKYKRSISGDRQSKGYDFQSSLAISDVTGEPITPLIQNLKTDNQIHSTYKDNIDMSKTHLEELDERSQYVQNHFNIKKKIVDIIDREADSIALFRAYDKTDRFYIIRAKGRYTLYYKEQRYSQKDLAKDLDLGKYVKSIIYKNKDVKIYVNEIDVVIKRDSYEKVKKVDGSIGRKKVRGNHVKSRFIVEKLVNEKQEVVATWILLSNLKDDVPSEQIALWYYYRWNIESYFKLLKSSGFNLEKWQQRDSLALFKRLLIVSYACVLVWKIANSNHINSDKIRDFLVKLSGRLVEKKKKFTSSALLAGLWSFFLSMDILEMYEIEELLSIQAELSQIMKVDF